MSTIVERMAAGQYTLVLDIHTPASDMDSAISFIDVLNVDRVIETLGYEVAEDVGYCEIKESHYTINGCKVLICYLNEDEIVYRFAPLTLNS